jgi:anti-anti-sigma factor
MKIKRITYNDYVKILPKGKLDPRASKELESALNSEINKKTNFVRVDFSDIISVSSAALRMLVIMQKKYRAAGLTMTVIRLNDMIGEVFEITGFGEQLDIENNEDLPKETTPLSEETIDESGIGKTNSTAHQVKTPKKTIIPSTPATAVSNEPAAAAAKIQAAQPKLEPDNEAEEAAINANASKISETSSPKSGTPEVESSGVVEETVSEINNKSGDYGLPNSGVDATVVSPSKPEQAGSVNGSTLEVSRPETAETSTNQSNSVQETDQSRVLEEPTAETADESDDVGNGSAGGAIGGVGAEIGASSDAVASSESAQSIQNDATSADKPAVIPLTRKKRSAQKADSKVDTKQSGESSDDFQTASLEESDQQLPTQTSSARDDDVSQPEPAAPKPTSRKQAVNVAPPDATQTEEVQAPPADASTSAQGDATQGTKTASKVAASNANQISADASAATKTGVPPGIKPSAKAELDNAGQLATAQMPDAQKIAAKSASEADSGVTAEAAQTPPDASATAQGDATQGAKTANKAAATNVVDQTSATRVEVSQNAEPQDASVADDAAPAESPKNQTEIHAAEAKPTSVSEKPHKKGIFGSIFAMFKKSERKRNKGKKNKNSEVSGNNDTNAGTQS